MTKASPGEWDKIDHILNLIELQEGDLFCTAACPSPPLSFLNPDALALVPYSSLAAPGWQELPSLAGFAEDMDLDQSFDQSSPTPLASAASTSWQDLLYRQPSESCVCLGQSLETTPPGSESPFQPSCVDEDLLEEALDAKPLDASHQGVTRVAKGLKPYTSKAMNSIKGSSKKVVKKITSSSQVDTTN